MYGIIYKIMCLVNGKIYIGQTTQNLNDRWGNHKCDSKNPRYPINYAIKKYGIKNFSIEQIDVAENLEELNKLEGFWIKHYNSSINENGYNVRLIEDGSHLVSKETKNKISIKNQGIKRDNSKSKFIGVSPNSDNWIARTCKNGKIINLGTYVLEEGAAKAYDIFNLKNDINSKINFPELKNLYLEGKITVEQTHKKKLKTLKYIIYCKKDKRFIVRIPNLPQKAFKTQIEAENYHKEIYQKNN